MVLLENKLAKWMISAENKKKVRPFSHLANHPKMVEKWVVLKLAELGDPVAFDQRTCEVMHEHDVFFYAAQKRSEAFLHAVRVLPGPKQRQKVARDTVTAVLREAVVNVATANNRL